MTLLSGQPRTAFTAVTKHCSILRTASASGQERKTSRLRRLPRLSLLDCRPYISIVIGSSRTQPQASRCSASFLSQIEILIWTSVIWNHAKRAYRLFKKLDINE
jgi:hypothetical protein